jgi:hypothetical protein
VELPAAFADARTIPKPCIVARALHQLDGETRTIFQAGLDHPDGRNTRIAEAFRDHGQRLGHEAVRKHRNRACSCD